MASNNNVNQEDTAIDRLNENLTNASDKIVNNGKAILWAVGGLVVIAAFVLSYLFIYRNPKLNRAFEAYNQVEITAAGNDSVAAQQYKKVAAEYSGTDAGRIAALDAAEAFYNTGKYKDAIECLDEFSSSEPVLAANAMVLKGDCYVNLKKYDDAISCYEKAIGKAGENIQIVPRVLLKEANVYDEQKKYDKALQCYERIEKEYPAFQPGNGVAVKAYIEREKARL